MPVFISYSHSDVTNRKQNSSSSSAA